MNAVTPPMPNAQELAAECVHHCEAVVFAKDQPEYTPLPALIVHRPAGQAVVTRWQFTDDERAAIAAGADLNLELLTFGNPLQPIRIYVDEAPESN